MKLLSIIMARFEHKEPLDEALSETLRQAREAISNLNEFNTRIKEELNAPE